MRRESVTEFAAESIGACDSLRGASGVVPRMTVATSENRRIDMRSPGLRIQLTPLALLTLLRRLQSKRPVHPANERKQCLVLALEQRGQFRAHDLRVR